jgi:hypothetical protein
MVFSRFDRFVRCGEGANEPLVIGLALQVGCCRRFSLEDAFTDGQPNDHNAIADSIECSPPETTDCFEHRVRDFADDLRWL